jgi:hypothetical protein
LLPVSIAGGRNSQILLFSFTKKYPAMKFNIEQAIQILERTPAVVSTLLKGLDDDWVMQNEGGETWSAYDIIGHYIHGEKTDWIGRMKIILGDGDKHFKPFNRFAQFEESKGKTLDQLLGEFEVLRKENLAVLKGISFTDEMFDRTGIHPKFGEVTLRQLLSTWVVHDLTHIHQLSRVLAKQYEQEVGPWYEFLGVLNKY